MVLLTSILRGYPLLLESGATVRNVASPVSVAAEQEVRVE
jgi:hypothetical protein